MSDQDGKFITNEQAQAATRKVAVIVLVVGLAVACWVWPDGITALPLSSITLGALLRAIASGSIGLIFLFIAAMFWI